MKYAEFKVLTRGIEKNGTGAQSNDELEIPLEISDQLTVIGNKRKQK
ncbi:MAG: hypothetical protein LBT15_06025 [Synergistaceae bacterium]|jgi:hypothetical protein|nr:hypothetical protein [Synergistaceae bacterium]